MACGVPFNNTSVARFLAWWLVRSRTMTTSAAQMKLLTIGGYWSIRPASNDAWGLPFLAQRPLVVPSELGM
jgi:hypothetical protein